MPALTLAPQALELQQPINWAHPLNRGLRAWWKVVPQWRGGKRWLDLSGRAHGLLTNMGASTATSGWSGKTRAGGSGALLFDGSNDIIVAPAQRQMVTFTISVWAWPVLGGTLPLLGQGNSDTTQTPYYLKTDAGGFTTGPSAWQEVGFPVLGAQLWHHLVMTYNGAALVFYRNGVQAASGSATGTPQSLLTSPCTLGRLGDYTGSTPFNGAMDDIRIQARALTATEVMSLYAQSRLGHPETLRWRSPLALAPLSEFPPGVAGVGAPPPFRRPWRFVRRRA